MKILSPEKIVVGLEYFNPNDYPKLKVVGCNMTSVEHLPWKQIRERGIKVISLKDYPLFLSTITSTAEHTAGLMIALLRNYKTALNYPYKERDFYIGHTLSDKVLGIIGFGRVGKQLKKMAVGFSMTVITHEKGEPYLDNLLEESDIVSLNIPLQGNEGFFTKEMFKKMKPTAILTNTSRSAILERGALLWALENKVIAGASIDFIDEPELVKFAETNNNLILTPHCGGNTYEDREKTEKFIINQVEKYIQENL